MKFTHRGIPFHLAFLCTEDIESEGYKEYYVV